MTPFTITAWLILVLPSFISQWFLALGCMYMVAYFKKERWLLFSFIIMWFYPPLLLSEFVEGQCDSWFLALLVWSVYFCLKEKWILSGILAGCALMVKGQALFMMPALIYYFMREKKNKAFLLLILSLAVMIFLLAAPFTLKSGMAWFHNSYTYSFTDLMPFTTIKAFNIWMIDFLIFKDLHIDSTLLGLTRRIWSLIFCLSVLILSMILCFHKYKDNAKALIMLISLTFASVFLFSVKVQPRYIIYFLPFLMIMSFIDKNFTFLFTGFSIIAIFENTANIWFTHFLAIEKEPFYKIILLFVLSVINLFFFILWIIKLRRYNIK